MIEIASLTDQYFKWLKDNYTIATISDGVVEVTTPFLDRHNDYIQVYATKMDDGYTLSDDGYTLGDLSMSGVDIDTPKREAELRHITQRFGVSIERGALSVACDKTNFPQRKHDLLQAILAVDDMYLLSKPNVAALFQQDVLSFLTSNNVHFMEAIGLDGRSGLYHAFDYAIPHTHAAPDRFIKTVNQLDKQQVAVLRFMWEDTKARRKQDAELFAFYNDTQKDAKKELRTALEDVGVVPVAWSRRNDHLHRLTA